MTLIPDPAGAGPPPRSEASQHMHGLPDIGYEKVRNMGD